MKRVPKQTRKFLARLESFEQRICMAGDLQAFPQSIEILDAAPIADFAYSTIVDLDDALMAPPDDSLERQDVERDEVLDVLTTTDPEHDLADNSYDPWVAIEHDFLIDEVDVIDDGGQQDGISPGDFVGDLPSESSPEVTPPSLPGLDHPVDQTPPPKVESDPHLISDNITKEGNNLPADPRGDSPEVVPPPQSSQIDPTPQPKPAKEEMDRKSQSGSMEDKKSNNPITNPMGQSVTLEVGAPLVETSSSSSYRNQEIRLPPVQRDIQRFSSTEIALTVINDSALDATLTGGSPALSTLASLWQPSMVTPSYFVRRHDPKRQVILPRESYCDQSIAHQAEDVERGGSSGIASEVLLRTTKNSTPTSNSSHRIAASLIGYFFGAKAELNAAPKGVAIGPGEGFGAVEINLLGSEADRESSGPPEQGPLQQFLGMMMSWALIAIQEVSRTQKNNCDQENSLHLKRFSTLKNRSNS